MILLSHRKLNNFLQNNHVFEHNNMTGRRRLGILIVTTYAVSYTHLDVYKRQIQFLPYICVSSMIIESIACHVPKKSHLSRLDATSLAFR